MKKGTDWRGQEWHRNDVQIAQAGTSVLCKLWRQKSKVQVNVGDTVKFSNMTVSRFRNVVSLDSSRETECEV